MRGIEVEAMIAAQMGILGLVNLLISSILSFFLLMRGKFRVIFLGQNS